MVLNDDNTIVITSNRLSETGAPLLEQGMIVGQLALADALIIGNCNNQVKEILHTWVCIFGVPPMTSILIIHQRFQQRRIL